MKRRTLQVCLVYLTVALWMAPLVNLARHTLLFSGVVFLLSNNFSQVGSRSWQTHCRRSWTVCSRILLGSRSWMFQCQRSWWKSWSLSLTGVRRDVHFLVPQILEQSVEVVRALSDPGADC